MYSKIKLTFRGPQYDRNLQRDAVTVWRAIVVDVTSDVLICYLISSRDSMQFESTQHVRFLLIINPRSQAYPFNLYFLSLSDL